MKTTFYSAILQNAVELAGRAYTDDTGAVVLGGSDAIMFRTMIGQAVRRAWTYQPWPETTIHTLRRFAAPWTQLQTYVRGNIVWWPVTERYYVAIAASTINPPTFQIAIGGVHILSADSWYPLDDEYSADEWLANVQYTVGDLVEFSYLDGYYALAVSAAPGTPPTNATSWAPVAPIIRRVAWDQEWEGQSLGDPYGVYLDNPLTTEEPREATYTWDDEGLRVLNQVVGVYLHAWVPEPDFLSDPATVPTRFAQYAAMVGAGFMLRSEGKTDQGNQLVKMAEEILSDESSKITRRESRSGRLQIR